MGKKRSLTLPPSPSHSFSSSSSSDFEFTISVSPRKSPPALCPADDLFYKGQLLPLHLSPRISMVRTLLLASSSTSSSSDTATDHSRDSTDSHSSFTSNAALLGDCDSSRPSSVAADDLAADFKTTSSHARRTSNKYFSLSKFSSVFRKESSGNVAASGGNAVASSGNLAANSVKRMGATAKEVFRKYLKKAKPLYDKISKPQQKIAAAVSAVAESNAAVPHSFSGNLRFTRRRSCISSCPSSMRSSPNHSGVLSRTGGPVGPVRTGSGGFYGETTSSMEELQSAIQGAIAHCKNSMIEHKTGTVSKAVCNEI